MPPLVGVYLYVSPNHVGATLGRPSKIEDFRVSPGETTHFRLAAMDFVWQNPRATEGRPYSFVF